MGACVWACLLGGAFLGWAVTSSLLPPLWAASHTLQCFAAAVVSAELPRWLSLAAIGLAASLVLLAAAQLRKVPALLGSTRA